MVESCRSKLDVRSGLEEFSCVWSHHHLSMFEACYDVEVSVMGGNTVTRGIVQNKRQVENK